MNTEKIKGIIVPILIPVDDEENIDENKLRFVVNHIIENGVHGILAFGSNSEFYMFDDDEMIEGLRIIVEETNDRVPVFFGIGEIRTRNCIRLAKRAAEFSIDGISVLQPMFIQPTEDSLFDHFQAIAESVPNMPILLYNNPGRAGYTMSADLVEKLAHEVNNIVGMKDSSGDLTQLSEFIRRNQDVDFKVLSGKDTIIFPGLAVGAVGSVCSTGNMYPELVSGIYDKYVAGDYEGALEDQFTLNPIRLSQNNSSFPAATKDMANLMGLDVGSPIQPTQPTTGVNFENMKKIMHEAGVLKENSLK